MIELIISELRRDSEREAVFKSLLKGEIKPYRAYSMIYKNFDFRGSPYFVDWLQVFTPIEYLAWQSIRLYGLPFFPQYPIDGMILDFADPHKKIAIECDGKDWHDEEKDDARDSKLSAKGWIVYRISGSECVRVRTCPGELKELLGEWRIDQSEYEDRLEDWTLNDSEGIISTISDRHYAQQNLAAEC